jgi:hypothetical protein
MQVLVQFTDTSVEKPQGTAGGVTGQTRGS